MDQRSLEKDMFAFEEDAELKARMRAYCDLVGPIGADGLRELFGDIFNKGWNDSNVEGGRI